MTAKIKLNAASGGGSFSLQAPSSSANNRVITLPDIADGTLLTSQSSSADIAGTITMVDSWVVTSSFNATGAVDITANWAKHSDGTSNVGTIGTGMTESSGIFTFPTTGIYMVHHTMSGRADSGSRSYIGMRQYFSTNSGSSFSVRSSGYSSGSSSTDHVVGSGTVFYDVTNVSTHRIKFDVETSAQCTFFGNASNKNTGVVFIRLGDT